VALKSKAFGVICVLLGVFLLLNRSSIWAGFEITDPGIVFHLAYFFSGGRKTSGLLIPGGILAVSGIVCQISMLFDSWGSMWPGFLLAVAVGLFEF
jgi:hypothetical protein